MTAHQRATAPQSASSTTSSWTGTPASSSGRGVRSSMSLPPIEKTLIVVKPDAVARGLTGEIIARFERRGLRVVEVCMKSVPRAKAEQFYNVHKDKPFFGDLGPF